MAGCESNNCNFLIAYTEELNQVTLLNPQLSVHDVRVQVAQHLRPRFSSDIAARRQEVGGVSKYEGLDFEVTPKGDLYYPIYGRTDTELDERTRKLTPDQYRPSDTLTNDAIHDVIAQGATHVVTSYWRPKQDHRDFVELTIDPITRKGKIRMINTEALTGKTYSHQEMADLTKKMFDGLSVHTPADHVFVAINLPVRKAMSEPKVSSPKLDQGVTTVRLIGNKDLSESTVIAQKRPAIVQGIVEDTMTTTQGLINYFRERRDTKKAHPFSADKVLRDVVLHPEKFKALSVMTSDRSHGKDEYKTDAEMVDIWLNRAQNILDITPQQSRGLLEKVEETWESMERGLSVVSFVTETGVGIGGAVAVLDALSIPYPRVNEISDEPTLQDKEIFVLKPQQKMLVREFFLSEEADEQLRIECMENDPSIEEVDIVVLMWTKEFVRSLEHTPPKQLYEAVDHKEKQILRRIVQLWDVFLFITNSNRESSYEESEALAAPGGIREKYPLAKTIRNVEIGISVDEQEHMRQFSQAVMLWYLLKLMEYYRSIHSLSTYFRDLFVISTKSRKWRDPSRMREVSDMDSTSSPRAPRDSSTALGMTLLHRILKEKMPEGLAQKEDGHWLLFSIIWYLNMIREQALLQGINPQTQSTSSNVTNAYMPMFYTQGVIFIAAR